jgi:hypothetical protein
MTPFTIFHNEKTGSYVPVYDFDIPTQTGIGSKPEWVPVYHGETRGLLDKARQCREYVDRLRSKSAQQNQ